MNKSEKGSVSEAQILAALVKRGKRVCVPFDIKCWNGYDGQADYFAIYCPQTDKCYLISVGEATKHVCRLRVEPFKTKRIYKCLWAKDFEL